MNKDLYKQIFNRKSFHTFRERNGEIITTEELDDIVNTFNTFTPLYKDIKVDIKVVKEEDSLCHRNEEYCLMLFSENKDGYLQNIGYIGEQLDLYLVSKGIGSLWYGIARSKETYNGLEYVIMIAIAKVHKDKFRTDMFKAKRKELSEIWSGDELNIANIVRFAPSACNSQPWYVENKNNELSVYRKSKSGKVGIMPKNASIYFNQIDIGIFMCFIELCLEENNITFDKQLYIDNQKFDEIVINCRYSLHF